MTCAPASASRDEQNGAATACSTAMMVSPSSGSIGISGTVIAGPDPAIHPLTNAFYEDGWMRRSSPRMTRIGGRCSLLVRPGHAAHALGKIRQHQVGRDRRHLVQPGLAEFALDVVFLGKA